MRVAYLDDFGALGTFCEITEEEMKRRNKWLEENGLEEFGWWICMDCYKGTKHLHK